MLDDAAAAQILRQAKETPGLEKVGLMGGGSLLSADFIEANNTDPRVVVVRLAQNQGVGGATLAGYREAADRGAQVLVKVDGDDQMDMGYVAHLVAPILLGEADYAKGNRFTTQDHLAQMPRTRIFGNAVLSMAAKISTGYWNVFDPTNGFTAIEASVARLILSRQVDRRYFFETDLLYHLGALRAVVRDVPIPARYGDDLTVMLMSDHGMGRASRFVVLNKIDMLPDGNDGAEMIELVESVSPLAVLNQPPYTTLAHRVDRVIKSQPLLENDFSC